MKTGGIVPGPRGKEVTLHAGERIMPVGVWAEIARIRTPLYQPRRFPVSFLHKVSKSVAAAVSAAVGAYVVANQVGGVSGEEWGGVIGVFLFTAVVTYLAPKNTEPA